MDEQLGYYVDLLIQQGDLVQLVGFYKSDPASKKYIDRNLNSIRQSLGFPDATSFRQIVDAFDKANIDVIAAGVPEPSFTGTLISLKYISSVLDQAREALSYAFDTKNLDIIKYAIKTSPHYLDFSGLFLVKVMAPLLEEFDETFSMYPTLRNLLNEAISTVIAEYPHLKDYDGTPATVRRGRRTEDPKVERAINALSDYLNELSYQDENQQISSRRQRDV
ncbi:Hypothetical protein POVR1_LOCUS502 [uncultured virus]|nr:Hypothetical protein POVR1_LOCUS502 [uncultured virus]